MRWPAPRPALGLETRFFSIWFSVWSKLPFQRLSGFFLASWAGGLLLDDVSQIVCKSRIISLQTGRQTHTHIHIHISPYEFLKILCRFYFIYFLISWEFKCLLWKEYYSVTWCDGWSFLWPGVLCGCKVRGTQVNKEHWSDWTAPKEAGAKFSEDSRFPRRLEG